MLNFRSIVIGFAATALIPATAAMAQSAQPAADAAATAPSASAGTPAPASAAPSLGADGKVVLAPGTEVFDTQGGKVGTITKVEASANGQPGNVVLKTTKSEVLIPASSLARTDKHALIAMTAAQIDAAAAAAGGQGAPGQTGSAPQGSNPAS